uniref:SSD domain-containing protein n=1 Tax=Schistosoma curassoni TaxID=6186 RepID=A0A183KHI5_9TREM
MHDRIAISKYVEIISHVDDLRLNLSLVSTISLVFASSGTVFFAFVVVVAAGVVEALIPICGTSQYVFVTCVSM